MDQFGSGFLILSRTNTNLSYSQKKKAAIKAMGMYPVSLSKSSVEPYDVVHRSQDRGMMEIKLQHRSIQKLM